MKNNRKRGFTLIEVLGVIVILLLLVLVTTPIVVNYLKKASKDAKSVQEYTLKEAAKSWMSSKDNISLMPVSNNECIEVTLRELKEQGYIEHDIKDPETKELLSDDITVIIRKVNNDLTYEINTTGTQTCSTVVDSTYPRWTYVSSNKTAITKNDSVVIKIKSGNDISTYSLTASDITVKVGSTIVDNAIINSISCTGTTEITCDITISNIDKDGKLNLVIEKDTLTNTNDKKSRITPVLTDVIVDNKGPIIVYVSKNNTNTSTIYATDDDTVNVIFDAKDENISTAMLETSGVEVYVGNELKDVTKSISRTSITGGYRYTLSLTNITGDGELSIKVNANQVSDTLGNKNAEKIITPGIIIDNTLPVVTLNPSGTTSYESSVTSKITATDLNGIKEPIDYVWSSNSSTTSYNQTASNGAFVKLFDVTGDYYLIVNACDLAGNCKREVSSVYKLNNQAPEIVFIPNGNSNYETKKDVVIKAISNGPELNLASLKYTISTNTTDNVTKEFTNNETITLKDLSGTYYIIAEACDILGNCTREVSNPYKLDSSSPKVTYVSKTNTNRTAGQSTEYATKNDTITITFDGTDNISYNDSLTTNDITIRVDGNVISTAKTLTKSDITNGKRYTLTLTNVTGEGQLSIQIDKNKIKDMAGNEAVVGIITPGIIIDNTKPIISYGTNGNSTYQKSQSSTISVSDNREVNSSENLYTWATSTSTTPDKSFTSGNSYSKDGETGDYYLVAKACDKAGNCDITPSNAFKLDNKKPDITFGTNGNTNPGKTQSSTISVNDSHSGGNTTTYKYVWTKNPDSATPTISFTSGTSYSQTTGDGNYYIKAYACDNAGNCETVTSNAFLLDNTDPECIYNGENITWTKNNVTVTVTCSDTNGCKTGKSTNSWSYTSGTHSTEAISFEIEDNAGNTATCSKTATIYVDKEGPTIPTTCDIGVVSGSDTSGTIQTPATGSTDLGVGNITYKYIINTTGTTPENTNTNFSSSKNFTRSCGTSYYAYAIAIDGLGNRSTVKSCGTTSDGVDSYSEWGTCSASCGGGTQTRTNSCLLVTTDLSQSCNTQPCCQTPDTTEWEFNYTGNIQSFTVPETATYKLEVYGAQGGSYLNAIGGKGGYASGNVDLTAGDTIYIVVGGAGSNAATTWETSTPGGYNGGGAGNTYGAYSRTWYGSGGGGATHIGTFNQTLAAHGNTNGLYIVAGGGGGAMNDSGGDGGGGYYPQEDHFGGAGGGTTGGNGHAEESQMGGFGGTQTTGGNVNEVNGHIYGALFQPIAGSFGQGGGYYSTINSVTGYIEAIGGGGGGLYGGGGGWVYAAGGGGSGYTGGVTSGTMENGVRSGNGYAKITLIKMGCDENEYDLVGPTITFGTNGNSTYATSQSSTITVTDNVGVDASSLKFIWTNDPSATPTTSFTSGSNKSISGVTGTYYLKAYACDVNGNCTTATSNPFKLDNQAPVIEFGTNGNNTFAKSYSSTINVIDYHSGGNTTTYKYIWTNDPNNATPNKTFTDGSSYSQDEGTGSYYIKAIACDKVGNCATATSQAFKLDNTAPSISFGTNGSSTYRQSQSSTINVTDNHSGGNTTTYKYVWSTSTTTNPTTNFTSGNSYSIDSETGNYYLVVTACDLAGNCAEKVASPVFKLDNTKPTITLSPDGNTTYATSQSSKITVADGHSGGNTTTYKYIWSTNSNDTANISFTNNETVSKDGVTGAYYLIVHACDNAGNCQDKVSSNAFNISNSGPTITFGTNGNNNYAKSYSSTITVSSNGAALDTNSFKYIWTTDGSGTPNTSFTNGGTATQNSGTGDYYLKAYACDTIGNCTTATSNVFKLDNTAPEIEIYPNGNSTWAATQTARLTVTDNHSGGNTATYKYIWSTSNTATPDTSFESGRNVSLTGATGEYYLIAYACDKAGNCATVPSSSVFKTSNTSLSIEFGTNGNNTYAKSQSSTIIVNQGGAPLNTSTFKYIWVTSSTATDTPNVSFTSGATATQSSGTGNYYLKATACDTMDNCVTETSNVFHLDNTAPEITFGTNGSSTYRQSQSSTITVVDNHSGGDTTKYKYIWSSNSTYNPNTLFENGATVTKDTGNGDYYLIAKACDKAGNCTENIISNVFKLDNTAPVITFGTNGNSTWSKTHSTTISVTDSYTTINNSTLKYRWRNGSGSETAESSYTNGGTITAGDQNETLYLKATACDSAGNCVTTTSNGFNFDNTPPEITFGPNGNNTYAQSQSSTITVSASTGAPIDESSLKYIWSSNSTYNPNTLFENGATVTKDTGNGDYYLIAKACDTAGNCTGNVISNVFKLDNTAPVITFGTNGNSTWSKTHSTTISVADGYTTINNSTLKYRWRNGSGSETAESSYTNGGTVTAGDQNDTLYLKATACDSAGNCVTTTSNGFNFDNIAPTCSYSGENTSWTKNNVTVTVTCNDAHGCKANKSTNSWSYTSGTHSTEAISFEIEDNAGNKETCSKDASVFLDKEGPTTPNCSAPSVSGSNTSATGTTASGSTDTGVGVSSYAYVINYTGSTPASSDSNFSADNSFTRSCGASYYEYAIAIDALGNRSAVKYCGVASDPASSYSEWGACSESCDGGTQTRTNACPLVTENLSQECNTQSCLCDPVPTDITYNATESCNDHAYCSCNHGDHEGSSHCAWDEEHGLPVSWGRECTYSCPNGGYIVDTNKCRTTAMRCADGTLPDANGYCDCGIIPSYLASSRQDKDCPGDGAYCGSSCSDGCLYCYDCPDGSGVCGCETAGAHWIHVFHNRYNSDLGRVTDCCKYETVWYCPDGGTLAVRDGLHWCDF